MYSLVIGVWLSLVEYVVWDHGAGGSNPSTPIFLWDIDLVNKCDVLFSCPKTPAFSICAFFTLIPSVLPKFLTTIKVLRPTKKRPQRFSVAASCDLLFPLALLQAICTGGGIHMHHAVLYQREPFFNAVMYLHGNIVRLI